jgi:hypothetical protein
MTFRVSHGIKPHRPSPCRVPGEGLGGETHAVVSHQGRRPRQRAAADTFRFTTRSGEADQR